MTKRNKPQKGAEGKEQPDARRLPDYLPEIEAKRALYAAVGASLGKLEYLDSNTVNGGPDIPPDGVMQDEHDAHVLYRSIREHLDVLWHDFSMNYGRDFWKTFYVEMRLYLDACRADTKSGRRWRGKGASDAESH